MVEEHNHKKEERETKIDNNIKGDNAINIHRTINVLIILVVIMGMYFYITYQFGFFKISFEMVNILFYIASAFAIFVFISLLMPLVNNLKANKGRKDSEMEAKKEQVKEQKTKESEKKDLKKEEPKKEIAKAHATNKNLKLKEFIGPYDTELDILYKLVEQEGMLKFSALTKYFKVDGKKIEEWAQILEENKMVEVHYPPVGEAQIKKVVEHEIKNSKEKK
jgi:hypothetical protein